MVLSEHPGLSEVMEPLQSYLLSCNRVTNVFTDPSSVSEGVELLESFGGTALGSGCDAWGYLDFHDKEKILKT